MGVIRFRPIYQERVWGGRGLADQLGKALPSEGVFGESWEVVDREEAQSVVDGGEYDGWTLRELLEREGEAIMGSGWEAHRRFPVLVKWLDCQERLSLQVHPPEGVAVELDGEPKTECWYIAECAPGASLIAGLREGVSREDFEQALRTQSLEGLCHRFEVKVGMYIFIPSGRLHAIDAGNLILEIQENSDTTYRVYDWGRVGLDGKPRELHVEESLRSIDFGDYEPVPTESKAGEQMVADCAAFRTRKVDLAAGEEIVFPPKTQPVLLGMISGLLEIDAEVKPLARGENVLVPFASGVKISARETSTLLITDQFI